ncbi:MAG: serine/threonine-protein kinase, partial [Myxococcota bacterium]
MDEQPTGPTEPLFDSQPEIVHAEANAPTERPSHVLAIPVARVPTARAELVCGTRIGHYELIRELGRGGMGVVFLARDIRLVRRVAIKFLHTLGPRSNARFLSEARATARCRHDNIVVIHDVGEFQGLPFMVLEYLRGHTVHQLLDGSPMSVPRALELMVPVVRALVRAHEHGIVHRDLKPANIFVTEQ